MRSPLIAILVLAACANAASSARAPVQPAAAEVPVPRSTSGIFPTTLVPPANPAFQPMYRRLGELGNPAGVGGLVERLFQLEGFAVPIVVKQCGDGGESAFYAPATGSITLCYELLRYANELAGKSGADRYTLDRNALITAVYFTLHEIGHALIHALSLSMQGDEEDLADQFAFLVATSADDTALVTDLIRAPAAFLHHHGAEMSRKGLASEHRPGDQRAFTALCMLYGRHRDPGVGEALGRNAAGCIAETTRAVEAWHQALAPYSRGGAQNTPQGGLAPLASEPR